MASNRAAPIGHSWQPVAQPGLSLGLADGSIWTGSLCIEVDIY